MPPALSASELIHMLLDRRREILLTLEPHLLAEYRDLGKSIRTIEAQLARLASQQGQEGTEEQPDTLQSRARRFVLAPAPRIRMAIHKKKLIDFLRANGCPASRTEILTGTKIPSGSLSSLLSSEEFEQVERGLWRLKDEKK
jgi:hypothetical protein